MRICCISAKPGRCKWIYRVLIKNKYIKQCSCPFWHGTAVKLDWNNHANGNSSCTMVKEKLFEEGDCYAQLTKMHKIAGMIN